MYEGFDENRRMFADQVNSNGPSKTPNELAVDPNNNSIGLGASSGKAKKSKFKLSKKVKQSLKNKVSILIIMN